MEPLNNTNVKSSKSKSNKNTNDAETKSVSSLYDYVNEQTVHELREEANRVIEEKINSGVIDPQSLPLVEEWLNELYVLECRVSERDALLNHQNDVEEQAARHAENAVYLERVKRRKKIEEMFSRKFERGRKHELEDMELDRQTRQYKKDAKRNIKKARAEKKRQKAQAKLDKTQAKIKQDNIQINQETKQKLHDAMTQDTEAAHKTAELERDLRQREYEAKTKRAQTNQRIDAEFTAEQKTWQINQDKMEQEWENESKAMAADYSAKIAESERKMAEDLRKTHEAREKAFNDEKLHAENLEEALKNAKKAGKLKAKFQNAVKPNIDQLEKELNDLKEDSVDNDTTVGSSEGSYSSTTSTYDTKSDSSEYSDTNNEQAETYKSEKSSPENNANKTSTSDNTQCKNKNEEDDKTNSKTSSTSSSESANSDSSKDTKKEKEQASSSSV